jgi:hypothetical protein
MVTIERKAPPAPGQLALAFGNTANTPSYPNFARVEDGGIETASYPTAPNIQINAGDLLVLDTTGAAPVARPMSSVAWDTSLAQTQTDAAAVFLGVSLDQKNAADPTTRPIDVMVRGFASYPCTALAAALHSGAWIAPDGDGTHNLFDQQVVSVAAAGQAIGKLSREAGTGAVKLKFFFQSTLVYGALPPA